MKAFPLISILMPAYNAAAHLEEAIHSVLAQDYPHWELIVVNDGSKDRTPEILDGFKDKRIRVIHTANGGVSKARNLALMHMQGDYFAFLDADDLYTVNSLSARLKVFEQNPQLDFVDGGAEIFDTHSGQLLRHYQPNFTGQPRKELLSLSGNCFVSVSWMVKRNPNRSYAFPVNMTHGEDLIFFIELAKQGLYDYTQEVVLKIRRGEVSAMSNLLALERGYAQILAYAQRLEDVSEQELKIMENKIRVVMGKSYLRNGKISRALMVWLRGVKG